MLLDENCIVDTDSIDDLFGKDCGVGAGNDDGVDNGLLPESNIDSDSVIRESQYGDIASYLGHCSDDFSDRGGVSRIERWNELF